MSGQKDKHHYHHHNHNHTSKQPSSNYHGTTRYSSANQQNNNNSFNIGLTMGTNHNTSTNNNISSNNNTDLNNNQIHRTQQQQRQIKYQQMQNYYKDLQPKFQQMKKEIQVMPKNIQPFKNHQLPLARIKKIMKSDQDVRMISSQTPVLFAKACQIFITQLTYRAWAYTLDSKRRTLQRSDVSACIYNTQTFDFLIDIIPKQDMKILKKQPTQGLFKALQKKD